MTTSTASIARCAALVVTVLILSASVHAADDVGVAGTWLGTLKMPVAELRIGLEIETPADGEPTVTLVSLDQGSVRVAADGAVVEGGTLTAPFPAIRGKFVGELSDDAQQLDGTWTQMFVSSPLELRRVDALPAQARPQEPKPPYPYTEEAVEFTNPDGGHTLAGTLTLPPGAGPHPAVVMITGSGPQDRDESLMGHKPFLVIADALTRRGMAVLRCDDRGFGESKGDFAAATSADLATDTLAAVRFLADHADIDSQRIALCGHSEGAMLAPLIAADHPAEIAAVVLIAPPAVTGEEIIISQASLMEKKLGESAESIASLATLRRRAIRGAVDADTEEDFQTELADAIDAHLQETTTAGKQRDDARQAMQALGAYRTPWFKHFLGYDPAPALRRVRCPVLAIIGGRDVQVVPEVNLPPLREALAAAPTTDVTIESPPKLNHLLQTSKSGLPTEYGMIEETIAPSALEMIVDWTASRLQPK
ncbi:Alpha/beta hydrolase family protein [Posidoniimonas polymericola]|uniref:Alpha/beta hydrolase family protein n=1 Tax=Posidoniimonas polymericola TaxID=2528002 RepID=A0A5C5YRK4_9BACT|nr:alpha/beta hydrolase [Posidoniimonas polymericola]TWT77519.1 Alpha/beta hydrolase family protein [Posidoniimonas polymericola]